MYGNSTDILPQFNRNGKSRLAGLSPNQLDGNQSGNYKVVEACFSTQTLHKVSIDVKVNLLKLAGFFSI